MTPITYRSVTDTIRCGSGFAKNNDRLELVRLLVEAEADPTFERAQHWATSMHSRQADNPENAVKCWLRHTRDLHTAPELR